MIAAGENALEILGCVDARSVRFAVVGVLLSSAPTTKPPTGIVLTATPGTALFEVMTWTYTTH